MLVRGLCGVSMMVWSAVATAAVPTSAYVFDGAVVDSAPGTFDSRVGVTPQTFGPMAGASFAVPCDLERPGAAQDGNCLRFDGIAGTGPASLALAREALEQAGLPTLPEPGLWLQLLMGFGLAGVVVRLRRVGIESVVA